MIPEKVINIPLLLELYFYAIFITCSRLVLIDYNSKVIKMTHQIIIILFGGKVRVTI